MGGGALLTPPLGAAIRPRHAAADVHSDCPFSHVKFSYPTNCTGHSGKYCTESFSVDSRERDAYFDNVFGSVPTRMEVEKAIIDLKWFMLRFSACAPEFHGLKGIFDLQDPRMPQSLGYGRIQDAFHVMQTEPAVQRMVISISSDEAVWDAILSNEAVQDLRGLLCTVEEKPQSSNEESDIAAIIVQWILDITKSKVMELIEKFKLLVRGILQPSEKEKPTSELNDLLEAKLRSSLLLSLVILLIVVVTRSHEYLAS